MKKASKKILVILLCILMISGTFVMDIGTVKTEAAEPQKAMFIFKNTLYVTCNVANHAYKSSYPYRKPIDIIDNVSGDGNAYAPFDCKVVGKFTSEGNTVAFESLEKVQFADGTIDYMTFMLSHDNNISNISVGNTYTQGSVIYQEGNAGTSAGTHIHLEVARGAYSKRSSSSQSIWAFVRGQYNAIYPNNAFYLYEGTKISNTGGYTWQFAKTTYTLTYDANGGSGAPDAQKVSATENFVTLSSVEPHRTGYQFDCWSETKKETTSGSTRLVYAAGSSLPNFGKNITLYAQWKPNTLKVYYNANGGSISSDDYKLSSNIIYKKSNSTKYFQKWTYNNAKDNGLLNRSSFGIYKEGYTFAGWGTKASGGTIFDPDDTTIIPTDLNSSIKNGDCSITLYAQWKPNTLKVYYNANGGSISSDDYKLSSNIIYKKSDSTKYFQKWTYNNAKDNGLLNRSSFGIYKEGYTFAGWGTKASGGTIFDPYDTTIVPTDITSEIKNGNCSITLYAIWEKNPVTTYTLSYNANGGSTPPANQTGATSYTISSAKPTRSGYTFLGWSKSSSATTASYKAGDTITLTDNTTLYAVWKYNSDTSYTLTFDATIGAGAPSPLTGKTEYTIPQEKPGPSEHFYGWSTTPNSVTAEYFPGDKIALTKDTTLYAVWHTYATPCIPIPPIVEEPTTKPTESTTKPTETTKPAEEESVTKPSTTKPSTTKPVEVPTTKPAIPTTKPAQPTTKPSVTTTKPTDPATKPSFSKTCPYCSLSFSSEAKYNKHVAYENEKKGAKVDIRNPSQTEITYGDSIILHADIETLPEGWSIKWSSDNGNFSYTASDDGTTCTVTPVANGDTVFTARVVDKNGNEISSDTQTMTSNAGFIQKIIAFFKKLFGMTKVIPEDLKIEF